MVRGNGSSAVLKSPRVPKEKEVRVERLEITPARRSTIKLHIVGVTPVIVHQWGEKAKRKMLSEMMRDRKTETKKPVREPRVPFEEFVGSLHVLPGAKLPEKKLEIGESWPYKADTFALPCSAFANGARDTAKFLGIASDVAKRAFFVVGEYTALKYKNLVMREDPVKLDCWPPKTDLRYRGMFEDWSCDLLIDFDEDLTSAVQIVNLFNRAGDGGVCEWRPTSPKKQGPFGRYRVEA